MKTGCRRLWPPLSASPCWSPPLPATHTLSGNWKRCTTTRGTAMLPRTRFLLAHTPWWLDAGCDGFSIRRHPQGRGVLHRGFAQSRTLFDQCDRVLEHFWNTCRPDSLLLVPPFFRSRNSLGLEILALRRSEEHTSELQSPCNLVCRLLLEKKKKIHELAYSS